MVLSDKQRDDLNKAVADYLKQNGYNESYKKFKEESEVEGEGDAKHANILEKKWTSIVRLQKKINDLQAQLSNVKEEVQEVANPSALARRKDPTQWIPRAPHAHSLLGHRLPITATIFHPNFVVVATASEDTTIKLWDFESGEFEKTLKGHTDSVNSIAFSPDGKVLASSSADMTIKIWDFTTGDYECLKTLHGHDHTISSVKFLSNELIVSASRDKSIKIWQVETGYCTATLKGHLDWVRRAIPSPCGKMLASCSNDQSVKVWDIEKKEIKSDLREHDHVVEDVAWSIPNAVTYIIKGIQNTGGDSKPIESVSNEQNASRFVISCSRDKTIKLWDIQTNTLVFNLLGHDNWVREIKFHPGGRWLLSASDDRSIKTWDLENVRAHKTLNDAHEHFVACLDIHKKGNRVVSGSVDTKINLWDCR